MSSPPKLTDPAALARNRARSRPDAMFLHDLAVDDIQDRLSVVNRTFTAPAVVTGFPQIWRDLITGAVMVPDDDTLALEPGAHDLVVHAMSLHWANDPVGQLIQCRRALKPDGLFLSISFAGETLNELRACLAESEIALRGGLSPRVAPMADLRDLGGLMQRAGFALPVADLMPVPVRYATLPRLMRDLRGMGEGNALAARDRRFAPRDLFAQAARRYAEAFPDPEGGLRASFEFAVLTGWAPAESQPKPLRPGSAQQRLADALGTPEIKLPD